MQIPGNDTLVPYTVVSESYELLRATTTETNTEKYYKDEWMLKRASSNAPLREARIRSFKPLTRNQPYHVIPTADITIRPYVFNFDPDYRYTTNEISNDFNLYNAIIFSQNIGDMELELAQSKSYTTNVAPSLETTRTNINNTLNEYFRQFNDNGTFDFSNGTVHNYITNFDQGVIGIGTLTNYSPPTGYTITSMVPVRNGFYAYELTSDGGTSVAYAVEKPMNLAASTRLYPLAIASSTITEAVCDKADCASGHVVIIRPDQLIIIDIDQDKISNIPAEPNYSWKHCACNDREILVHTSYLSNYHTYMLSNFSLVNVNNTYAISAIAGYNDKFIFASGIGATLKIYLTDKAFQDVNELVIEDWTPGTNATIYQFDVVNGIKSTYIVAWDEDHYRHYFIEANTTLNQTTKLLETTYKSNGYVESGSYNNSHVSHCKSNFVYCRNYSGYSQVWGFTKTGENIDKIGGDLSEGGTLTVSGGWYACIAATTSKYIELIPDQDDSHVLTISDYLNEFSFTLTQIPILNVHYSETEKLLYGHNLIIPLTQKCLIFNVEISTTPYSLIFTRVMEELTNDIINLDENNYYLNIYNNYITVSEDYEREYEYISALASNYYINLCSPHMNNISNIIYNTYTEANVVFKRIDNMPSSNYLIVYLTKPDGTKPTIEELKNIFSAIYVEIDYIYDKV